MGCVKSTTKSTTDLAAAADRWRDGVDDPDFIDRIVDDWASVYDEKLRSEEADLVDRRARFESNPKRCFGELYGQACGPDRYRLAYPSYMKSQVL